MHRDIERLADREIAGPQLQQAIRNPDATLGWSGDPALVIAWNRLLRRWEVWREEPWLDHTDNKWYTQHVPVLYAPEGDVLEPALLIRQLVKRDSYIAGNSHVEAMEKHFKNLEAEQVRKDKESFDRLRPTHEKLAWTLAKATEGTSTFVSLSGAVKERNVDAS